VKRVLVVDGQLDAAATARLIAEHGGEAEVEIMTEDDLEQMRASGTLVDVGNGFDLDDHIGMIERLKPERDAAQPGAGQGRRHRAQRAAGEAVAEVLVETRQQRRAAARAARKGVRP